MTRKVLFDAVRPFAPGGRLTPAHVTLIDAVADAFGLPAEGAGHDDARARPASPSRPDAGAAMRTSPEGIALIHSFESLHRVLPDGRIAAYPDPGPTGLPWTIGWGSTGPDIGRDTIWTRAQADARFAADLRRFEDGVMQALGGAPVTQSQFDALVSFAYNVGISAMAGSTLVRKHKAGDYAGAQAEFARWNKAKGKVLPGLTRRRAAEAALYGRKP
ncbi:MAG: lysozyme [Brevundimonas sp.]|jgi:GH24 family phage-related lysozyme (muramidase)|uniref:lysozyme n=1 Tax=Brevundimonas sp. TaxID=1871086 RepID=UPI003919666D